MNGVVYLCFVIFGLYEVSLSASCQSNRQQELCCRIGLGVDLFKE